MFQKMPNNVFSCQHHRKRPKKFQTMTYMPNKIFSCQTTFKKAKFLEFGLKNANLATLTRDHHFQTNIQSARGKGNFPLNKLATWQNVNDARISFFKYKSDTTILFQNPTQIQKLTVSKSNSCLNQRPYHHFRLLQFNSIIQKQKSSLDKNSRSLFQIQSHINCLTFSLRHVKILLNNNLSYVISLSVRHQSKKINRHTAQAAH